MADSILKAAMTNSSEDLRTARRTAVEAMFDFVCDQVAKVLTAAEQKGGGRCVAIITSRNGTTYAMVHSLGQLQHVETLPDGGPDFTNLFTADEDGIAELTIVDATDELREWLHEPQLRSLTDVELAQLDEIHRHSPLLRDGATSLVDAPDIEGLNKLWLARGEACRAVLDHQHAILREILLKAELEGGKRLVAPVGPYWLSGDSKYLFIGNQMADGTLEMDNPCDTEFDGVGDETIVALSNDLDGWDATHIRPMTDAELEGATKSDVD